MSLSSLFADALGGVQIEPIQSEIVKQLELCYEEADGAHKLTRDTVSALLNEEDAPQPLIQIEDGVSVDLDTFIDAAVWQYLPNEPFKRRQSNLLAAKRSRLRKNLKLKTLLLLVNRLETKNNALERENKSLKQKLCGK